VWEVVETKTKKSRMVEAERGKEKRRERKKSRKKTE